MNNRILLLVITLLLSSIIHLTAQQSVKGLVVDSQGKGIEFVNVVAMKLPDSTYIAGCMTSSQGVFQLAQLPTECYLVFSSVGYQKQSHKATSQMHIVLDEAQTTLSEVTVVARRLTERPGGYSMRMQNNPLMKGKKVVQALELLPNIHIENGKVQILNRAVEAIYIDGLRLQDSGELASLPIEQIDRIEVDYTSAVREGAGGTGGVLRIFLKKQSKGSWSANIGAETHYMPYYGSRGGSIDSYLSARWDKLTLRNSMNIGKQLYLGDEQLISLVKKSGLEQRSFDKYRNWTTSTSDRLSVSYEIAPKHLVATSLLYHYSLEAPEHTTTNQLNGIDSYQRQHNPMHLWQWLATYNCMLSQETSLDVSADLLNRHLSQSTVEQSTNIYDASVKQRTRMLRIKSELKHRFKRGEALTLGEDLQRVKQDEQALGLVPTAMKAITPSLYSTLAGKIGKLQYEVGLRLQHNEIQTTQAGEVYKNTYTGIFPSLSAMYLLSAKYRHMVNLQIERVMDPIPYSAISGYRQYNGTYSYTTGNPSLVTPIGTQAIALLSLWGKLNITLGAIHYQSPIYFERKVDGQDPQTTYTTPMNGKYQLLRIASVEWRHKLTNWWSIKTSALLRLNSADAGVVVNSQAATMFRHNSTFTFSSSFGAGLRLVYEPTYRYLDRTMNSIGSISGDVYKSFLHGNLDVRLDFTLYRKERSSVTENSQLVYRYENLTHSPSFSLSVSYRFGGGKKVKALADTKVLQQYHQTTDVK